LKSARNQKTMAIVEPAVKRAFLTAATVASALAVAPAALADDPPKPPRSNGAVSVYVEQIPTSKGTVAAGASNNSSRALPPKVEKKLQSQPKADADRLKTIATSSGYGAPQTSTPTATAPAATPATPAPTAKRAKPKPKPKRATKKPATTTPIQPQTPTRHPDATASAEPVAASDDGGRGMLVAALVGLAALAAAGAAVALRRGRSARPRTR